MRLILPIVFLTILISNLAWAGRADKREHRQQGRIREGVKSGELTGKEARHLERQQARIHKTEHRMKSDGELDSKEKAKLEKMQDKASKDIYEEKHDEEKRPE